MNFLHVGLSFSDHRGQNCNILRNHSKDIYLVFFKKILAIIGWSLNSSRHSMNINIESYLKYGIKYLFTGSGRYFQSTGNKFERETCFKNDLLCRFCICGGEILLKADLLFSNKVEDLIIRSQLSKNLKKHRKCSLSTSNGHGCFFRERNIYEKQNNNDKVNNVIVGGQRLWLNIIYFLEKRKMLEDISYLSLCFYMP